jgi:hypothetical protein
MPLVFDQSSDHLEQVEEEHDKVEAELDERFLPVQSITAT